MARSRASAAGGSSSGPDASSTTPVSPPLAASGTGRAAVGEQLGRYVVLELVGKGAMGEVLRAYDPKLRRELAIKRINPTRLPAEAEARLVREAQAMAQLGHPNVVAVYDVEVTERGVLVAMEYVRGTTLETWLLTRPPWREIVRVFVQAGRGLQAAHEAGLVHRDFKPANVLVGDDGHGLGRVRVADFGLVKVVEPDRSSIDGPSVDDSSPSAASLPQLSRVDESLTGGDVVLGTPKYMAPEQHSGPALPASDQFAFCVSLWEAFVGKPPYKGSALDLVARKLDGPPPWPRGIAIPRRIVTAIERGLSPRPEDRFPSMDALVAELARDATARRNLYLGLGAAVVSATAFAAFAISRDADKCTGAESQLDETWGPARRDAVQQAFVATGAPLAEATWPALATSLDKYAEGWAAQHRESCEATTVRGEQSTAVMDLRMGCLGRARGELDAIVGVFEQPDAKTVERAHRLLENLPDLHHCEDIAALQQDVAPPPAGPVADAVATAREDLARSRALYRIGRYEDSLALADEVDARTHDLDYPPIHAEAALGRGDVLDYLGRYDESEAALRRALQIAMREGSYEVAIKAASSLVFVVGQYLGRPTEAQWPAEIALDLAIRIGAEPVLEARARNSMGAALRTVAKWDESEVAYREGIRRLAEAVGERDGRVATLVSALGSMLSEAGRYDRALPELQRALELRRELLGKAHPDAALSAVGVAYVLMELGRFEEAETLLREGLQSRIEAHGPDHFFTANARSDHANALTHLGRADEALPELETAVRSIEATLPEGHSGYIDPVHHYAVTLLRLGRLDDAEVQARRALEAAEAAYGADHPLTGEEVANVAEVLAARGELGEAEVLARRAVAILVKARSPDHVTTLEAKAVLGEVLLARGDRAGAVPILEDVWTSRERIALAPHQKARSAFALARALTSPSRAEELAKTSAAAYRSAGPAFADELTAVERWLDDN